MLTFTKSRWVGNKWASIEIDPVDASYFLPVLYILMTTYKFPPSKVIDSIDGYIVDFRLHDCQATMSIDTWTFSIAFERDEVRDSVFDMLTNLPPDTFNS